MALERVCGIVSNQALLDQRDPQNISNRAAVESFTASYILANPTFTPTSTSTIVIPTQKNHLVSLIKHRSFFLSNNFC